MDRLLLISLVFGVTGLFGVLFSGRKLLRALRFRLQRGRPYVPGSIGRAATSFTATAMLLVAGGMGGAVHQGARGLYPITGSQQVARLRVIEDASGGLMIEVESRSPGVILASGLEGTDWALTGLLVTFPSWLEPLGLTPRHLLLQAGSGGASARPVPESLRQRLDRLQRLPLGMEVARRSVAGRGPRPGWLGVRVSRDGYTLSVWDAAAAASGE